MPWARRILADRDALKQEVTALRAGLTGELRLGVVPAASTTVALLTIRFVRHIRWCGFSSRSTSARPGSSNGSASSNWTRASCIRTSRTRPICWSPRCTTTAAGAHRRRRLLGGEAKTIAWSEAVQLPLCLLRRQCGAAGSSTTRWPPTDLRSPRSWKPIPWPRCSLTFAPAGGRASCAAPHGSPAWVCPGSAWCACGALVTALIALVTNSAEPGSLLARALRRTAREARIGATLSELP